MHIMMEYLISVHLIESELTVSLKSHLRPLYGVFMSIRLLIPLTNNIKVTWNINLSLIGMA